jgi:hypothetical protein
MRGSVRGQMNAPDSLVGNPSQVYFTKAPLAAAKGKAFYIGSSPCNGTRVGPLALPNYSFSSRPFRRLRTTSTWGEIELGVPATSRLTDFLGFLASRLETSFLAMAYFL